MKKKPIKAAVEDDLRPEYDLPKLKGAVRGKHYQRYRAGTNGPADTRIRAAFPTDAAVNDALRSIMAGSK